jgi:hypothetical protein
MLVFNARVAARGPASPPGKVLLGIKSGPVGLQVTPPHLVMCNLSGPEIAPCGGRRIGAKRTAHPRSRSVNGRLAAANVACCAGLPRGDAAP